MKPLQTLKKAVSPIVFEQVLNDRRIIADLILKDLNQRLSQNNLKKLTKQIINYTIRIITLNMH